MARIVRRLPVLALLLAAGISSARAAAMPSFEQTLGQFRADFKTLRAAQVKAKAMAAAQDIDNLASDADRLRWDAQRLRNEVNDLKWRVQRRNDPWVRNDLQRLVWNLQDDARFAQELERRAQNVLNAAQKDPAAVPAAQRLQNAAGWLRSETGWLQMDAQNAAWDFRRAGYNFEAFDVENAARDAQYAAQDIESLAGRILSKVRN